MSKSQIRIALGLAFGVVTPTTYAVSVNNGDTLSIYAGVNSYDSNGNFSGVSSGSWLGMDTDGSSKISGAEKVALSQGTVGLTIGSTTSAGASHSGAPTVGDTNAITAPWNFFGNTGSDYLTSPVTGSTTTGLNFSGWTITWNGIPAINMGGGAWGTGYSNSIANFVWNGSYDHSYVLDYHATVPLGDLSGFGGVKYALHLEGCLALDGGCVDAPPPPIPEASTFSMLLSGLGLVSLVTLRRNRIA